MRRPMGYRVDFARPSLVKSAKRRHVFPQETGCDASYSRAKCVLDRSLTSAGDSPLPNWGMNG